MFTGLESPTHLIIVFVMILLLFGVKRTPPELAKGLGAGMREFKTGAEGDYDEEGEGHKRRRLEASAEDGRSEGVADI